MTDFIDEPHYRSSPGGIRNTYESKQKRWQWWYSMICDFRLANPGCKNTELAAALKKNPATIGAIISSDLYQEYEAQRKVAFQRETEAVIRAKLTGVTVKALDAMDVYLDKKRDQVPLELAREVAVSGLDRLGFSPKTGPAVYVDNRQDNRQVHLPNSVSATTLEEARMALRAVESKRGIGIGTLDPIKELEAVSLPVAEDGGLQATSVAESEDGSNGRPSADS